MTTRVPPLRFVLAPKSSRGLAAVEFVVTVPLLIVVMLAVAELGHALVLYDTLSYSVRDSARFVSEYVIPGDSGVISDGLIQVVQAPARNLVVYGSVAASGQALLPDGQSTTVTVSKVDDYNVRVDAHYPYQTLLGSAVLQSLTMHVAVTVRAIS
jgi:Flp pilus assembly protein TadG